MNTDLILNYLKYLVICFLAHILLKMAIALILFLLQSTNSTISGGVMEIANTQYPIAFDIQEGKKAANKKSVPSVFKNLFLKMIDAKEQQVKDGMNLDNWAEW